MEIYDEVSEMERIEMVDKGSDDLDMFDYAKQIIACQIEIKSINDDIKQIKIEAKENGVLIKEIDSVIADIKRELKKDPSETIIEDDIRAKFEKNEDIMASISTLI